MFCNIFVKEKTKKICALEIIKGEEKRGPYSIRASETFMYKNLSILFSLLMGWGKKSRQLEAKMKIMYKTVDDLLPAILINDAESVYLKFHKILCTHTNHDLRCICEQGRC